MHVIFPYPQRSTRRVKKTHIIHFLSQFPSPPAATRALSTVPRERTSPMASSFAATAAASSTPALRGFADARRGPGAPRPTSTVSFGATAAPSSRGSPALLSMSSHFGGLGAAAVAARRPRTAGAVYATAATEKSVHEFSVKDIDGKDVPLNKFKGKVLLIVNVASRCGLTSSNYTELSHIYEKYKTQGFEILAFPCNQFGGQEPGSNQEIKQFACSRFKAEFPIFDKVDVNGPNTAPVYQFLKANAGGFLGDLIKWNFEKFLVDKNGKVVERYPPTTSPFQIEKDIKKLLAV